MRLPSWNALVRLGMAAALLVTGFPLVRPWLPAGPLQPRPGRPGDPAPAAGQVVVDARDRLTPAQLQDLNTRYRLSLAYNSVHAREEQLLVSSVPPGQESAVAARLRKDPLVETAEPLHRYQSVWTPNDPRFPEQWNMKMVGAEHAWGGATGKGVTVAVIDTGVAFETDAHGCYQARDFKQTRFARGYDFVNDDEHPNDDHGHGTHVAGTIAESTNNGEGVAGLAFDARIMPIKVLDSFGGGSSADIADAIRFAADNGADVINMSLGGSMPDQVMQLACRYAVEKGVLVVCAAGNTMGGPVGYPAAFPECMAVSAVTPDGSLAWYSSVGEQVAVAAPGGSTREREEDGILQNTVVYDYATGERAADDYFAFQGTSMASPHVAAVAALVMSQGIRDPAEVRQLIERGAVTRGPKEHFGAGILSASRTVGLAGRAWWHSALLLLFTVLAFVSGIGVGVIRKASGGLTRYPLLSFGFALGLLGPNLLFGWLGFGSAFNIVLHSALIPLYLLWEAESRPVYRFVGMMALGSALHLGWDALQGHAPFGGVLWVHAQPWLWVNVAVGLGVALVAWRRSFQYP